MASLGLMSWHIRCLLAFASCLFVPVSQLCSDYDGLSWSKLGTTTSMSSYLQPNWPFSWPPWAWCLGTFVAFLAFASCLFVPVSQLCSDYDGLSWSKLGTTTSMSSYLQPNWPFSWPPWAWCLGTFVAFLAFASCLFVPVSQLCSDYDGLSWSKLGTTTSMSSYLQPNWPFSWPPWAWCLGTSVAFLAFSMIWPTTLLSIPRKWWFSIMFQYISYVLMSLHEGFAALLLLCSSGHVKCVAAFSSAWRLMTILWDMAYKIAQARLPLYVLLTILRPQGMNLWRRSWSSSSFMEWNWDWMDDSQHSLPDKPYFHSLFDENYSSSMKLTTLHPFAWHNVVTPQGWSDSCSNVMAWVGNRKLDWPTEDKHRNFKDNLNIVLSDSLTYIHNNDRMYTASPGSIQYYLYLRILWFDIISKHGFILSPLKPP